MIALLACRPEPAPPAPPPVLEDQCPGVDWAVRLDGPIEDIPEHVLPTPDGDVIIAGLTTGSIPVGTGPERLAPGQGFRDGFVARLAPDGRVRWSRVLGGPGIDQVLGIQLHGDQLWVAGEAEGPFAVDGEDLDAVSMSMGLDAYGLALDVADGRVLDYRRVVWPGWQHAAAFATDGAGRRFLTGKAGYGELQFAGLHTGVPPDGSNMDAAFLLSWDGRGHESWVVSFQPPRGEALGEALQVDVDPPLWAVFAADAASAAWSGGVHPDLPPHARDHHTVLSFDPATGQVSPTPFDPTPMNLPFRYDVLPTGLRWYGYAFASHWIDGDGKTHPIPENGGIPGVAGTVGSDGGVTEVWWDETDIPYFYGGDLHPEWGRLVAGLAPGITGTSLTFSKGTPFEATLQGSGREPDGFLALYDASDTFRCVWGAGGSTSAQIVHDAAFDGEGGIVAVGEFNGELVIRGSDEQPLLHFEEGPAVDGFVLRLSPPSWQ